MQGSLSTLSQAVGSSMLHGFEFVFNMQFLIYSLNFLKLCWIFGIHRYYLHKFFLNFRANVAHLEDLVYCSFLRYLYELWSLCPKWNSEKLFLLFAEETFGEFSASPRMSSQYYKYIDIININNSCALSKIEQQALIYCNWWNFILLRIYK